MSEPVPKGLLLVLCTLGDEIALDEFQDWYNNEHAPERLGVKGFRTALRYEAVDGKEPKWLALYDVDGPDVLTSEAYKSLTLNASERERKLLPRLAKLNRRVYSLISTNGDSGIAKLPSQYLSLAALGYKPEDEEGYEKWSTEEHMDMLSKVPGWLHSRRYKLESAVELIPTADNNDPPPGIFLHLHYTDQPWEMDTPEIIVSSQTPRSVEMLTKASSIDIRLFKLYKDIGKPTW